MPMRDRAIKVLGFVCFASAWLILPFRRAVLRPSVAQPRIHPAPFRRENRTIEPLFEVHNLMRTFHAAARTSSVST